MHTLNRPRKDDGSDSAIRSLATLPRLSDEIVHEMLFGHALDF